jgi:glycine oxidase
MDVLVIGGGVIGLGIAWELAQRGAKVRLLERARIGDGTTWAAAGILPAARPDTAIDSLDRLRGLSHAAYPQWADAILDQTGVDVGLRQCGGYYLASTVGEAASLVANVAYWQELGLKIDRLSSDQLAAMLPAVANWAISSQFKTAVFSEAECQIRPPDLLRGLAAACRGLGVQIDEYFGGELIRQGDHAAVRIRPAVGPGDATGQSQVITADSVVLCGGVWSGQAAEDFGLKMSMVPIRGQILLYRLPEPPFQSVVNEGHRYFVPRDDGHVLVGSTEEEVGFQNGTTPECLNMLARWAEGLLPGIAAIQPVKCWSGLRPATFDGFPIIGRVPDAANLFVAAGHFRSGVHLAPATAELIADLIEQKSPRVEPSAFSVGRMLASRSERSLSVLGSQ